LVPRRLGAEFVGTALLLIAVVGSGIAAQRLSPNDIGLELLEKSIATGAADWPQSSSRIEMALASVTASCDRQVRVMASAVIQRPSFRLLVPSAIILANYVAQIPYDLHLYGTSVSARGGGLLVLTLMWFVAGLWLLVRGNPAGYWLTMSFLATDFGFYLYNLVGGWVHGYDSLDGLHDWVRELFRDGLFDHASDSESPQTPDAIARE
jgi:hypothetical protein